MHDGNGARQSVAVKDQAGQIGEIAQFSGDLARQEVVHEVQLLQIGEIAQFRRDAALCHRNSGCAYVWV